MERLTLLLNALLTLAREGDRPPLRAPTSLRESLRGRALALGGSAQRSRSTCSNSSRGPMSPCAPPRRTSRSSSTTCSRTRSSTRPAGTVVTLGWDAAGHLAVADEGPGVEPGEERQVFERFHRSRRDRPGTGLGLAIVETLARRWGGTASIRNRNGGGAVAEVALPVEQTRAFAEALR